jgi:hypothetical protein
VTFVIVPDIAAPGAFNDHFKKERVNGRFDYIIHTASPLKFHAKDLKAELIDPAVQGKVQSTQAHRIRLTD